MFKAHLPNQNWKTYFFCFRDLGVHILFKWRYTRRILSLKAIQWMKPPTTPALEFLTFVDFHCLSLTFVDNWRLSEDVIVAPPGSLNKHLWGQAFSTRARWNPTGFLPHWGSSSWSKLLCCSPSTSTITVLHLSWYPSDTQPFIEITENSHHPTTVSKMLLLEREYHPLTGP